MNEWISEIDKNQLGRVEEGMGGVIDQAKRRRAQLSSDCCSAEPPSAVTCRKWPQPSITGKVITR
jgi:hypothetical protein